MANCAIWMVAAGAGIMTGNVLLFFALARELSGNQGCKKRVGRLIMAVYLALLLFFLLGYVAVAVMLSAPSVQINDLLVGGILFGGSVFVLLGIVIEINLSRTVKKTSMEATQALISAVEARDPNLNGHSLHVAKLTMCLYNQLPRPLQRQLPRAELEYAALLHDIGKLGVPERILDKQTALTSEEWEEIKKHPSIGKNILRSLDCFQMTADWVLNHHERWDGQGYYGLEGGRIPLASRVIAVADTYSAITMERSYHKARSHEDAAEVLRQAAGSQLDPALVRAFLAIPREDLAACRASVDACQTIQSS